MAMMGFEDRKGKGKGKFKGKDEEIPEGMRFKKQVLKDGTVTMRLRKVMTPEEREARDSVPLEPMAVQAIEELLAEEGSVPLGRVAQLLPGVSKKQLEEHFDVTPSETPGNWEVSPKGDGPSPAKKSRTKGHGKAGGYWAWEPGKGGKGGWGGKGYSEWDWFAEMSEMFWYMQSPEAWAEFSGKGGKGKGKGKGKAAKGKGKGKGESLTPGLYPGELVRNDPRLKEGFELEPGTRLKRYKNEDGTISLKIRKINTRKEEEA